MTRKFNCWVLGWGMEILEDTLEVVEADNEKEAEDIFLGNKLLNTAIDPREERSYIHVEEV